MANPYNPMIARGVTRSGKIVVADKPLFDDHRLRKNDKGSHREALREAITFANFVETHEVYIHKAMELGTTPYNLAITDWFGSPKVLEIDVDGWTGEVGQTIRVKAKDDTRVTQVTVRITAADETLLEQGEAAQVDNLWWAYTSTTVVADPASARIVATAEDRPGNRAELVWQN